MTKGKNNVKYYHPPTSPYAPTFVFVNMFLQASSAQGIELFEDLLWDLASLSFATHVFEPSLTLFPVNIGMGDKDSSDGTAARRACAVDTIEGGLCAELVSTL